MNQSPIAAEFKKAICTLTVRAHKLYRLNRLFEQLSHEDKQLAMKSVTVILKLLEEA